MLYFVGVQSSRPHLLTHCLRRSYTVQTPGYWNYETYWYWRCIDYKLHY